MSQSEHRSRLRQQRQLEAELANGQRQATTVAEQPTANQDVNVVATNPLPVTPPIQVETPVAPSIAPTIVPQRANFDTQGMTPAALREHGRQTAQILAQLPEDQYYTTLQSLEATNLNLYGIVCDELENMNASRSDDDGVDLSNIAGGSPNPNPQAATQMPPATQEQP